MGGGAPSGQAPAMSRRCIKNNGTWLESRSKEKRVLSEHEKDAAVAATDGALLSDVQDRYHQSREQEGSARSPAPETANGVAAPNSASKKERHRQRST